ncbi:MAG: hypothetical protein D6689_01850 [Deltaproteobacteria bacterium]|nr:MAG: hypothetical protein D6689_01850 [Deltaproteobacteria bacterium]
MTAPPPLRVLLLARRLRGSPEGEPADDVLGVCERAALRAALHIQSTRGARITAIAAGPAQREDRVLAMALRAGCDAAVRVFDPILPALDAVGVAHVLAATAARVGYDLVVCGDRSEDEGCGAIAAAVAEQLDVMHVTGAVDVRAEGDPAELVAAIRRAGRVYTVSTPLPAVVGVARFDRPLPDVAPERDADRELDESPRTRRPPDAPSIEEFDLEAVGLSAAELRYRRSLAGATRPARMPRQPVLLPDGRALFERLRDDHLFADAGGRAW